MKISAGYLTRDCVFISCLERNNMQTTCSIEGRILVCDLNLFPTPCWGCDMVWYFNAVPYWEAKLDWVARYSRVTAWLATKGVSSFQLQVSSITAMWVTLIEPKALVFNFMHTEPHFQSSIQIITWASAVKLWLLLFVSSYLKKSDIHSSLLRNQQLSHSMAKMVLDAEWVKDRRKTCSKM